METKTSDSYQNLLDKLNQLRRRKRLYGLLRAVLFMSLWALGVLGVLLILEVLFRPSPGLRMALLGMAALAGGVGIFWTALRPLGRLLLRQEGCREEDLATEVGRVFPELKDRLLNALQVYRQVWGDREAYSPELAQKALETVWERCRPLDFRVLVPFRKLFEPGRYLLAVGVFLALFAGLWPGGFREALTHLFHPHRLYGEQLPPQLVVSPGDVEKVEGDSLLIQVTTQGNPLSELTLGIREIDKKVFTLRELSPDSTGLFSCLLGPLKKSFDYFAMGGGTRSPLYRATVISRPFIRNLQVELLYPRYSQLGSRYLEENVGDITALRGTQVRLHLEANKNLQKARVRFQSGSSLSLRVSGHRAQGRFRILREDTYWIELEDPKGVRNRDPIRYRIRLIPDEYPLVSLLEPGEDVDLGEDMRLPLLIQAEDDFGFSKLQLAYKIVKAVQIQGLEDTTFHRLSIPLPPTADRKITVPFDWDLSGLGLLPEDAVHYFVEVWDNDEVSGYKSARTRLFTARFPSIYEIYQEVSQMQDQEIEDLEEVVEESRELKRRLDELAREMRREAKLDWLRKQDLEEITQKHESLREEIDRIRRELDELVERLEKNELLSWETLKKYQELQELFQEVMTPEMKKLLEELRRAFQELDPKLLRRSIKDFQLTQENFLRSIERTLSILKRLQIEQKLDQLAKLAQDLKERQERLNEALKEASPEEMEALQKQQEKLRKDAERLQEALEELRQKMSEFPDLPTSEVLPLQDRAEQIRSQMRQAEMQLAQGQMQGAMQAGQMAALNLEQLAQQLQALQQKVRSGQKREVAEALQRSSHELLRLSKTQEDLLQGSERLSGTSGRYQSLAEKQLSLLNNLGKVTQNLYELSQKTFFVTPEIGKAIGKALAHMREALKGLEDRQSSRASQHQKQALAGLNEAVYQIQNALNALSGAASGIGMEEFMRRLQQLAQGQQGINIQTLELQKKRLSLEQQAAMARLAAQQEALRRSLEELLREFGRRSEILGRLEGVEQEMRQVVKDLQNRRLTQQTIRRQQRILSRLLDAQRSVRRRDYSRKRQATPGKTYYVRSPGEIPSEVLQQRDRLREDLLRARRAGYSPDYLRLIERYFEALNRAFDKTKQTQGSGSRP